MSCILSGVGDRRALKTAKPSPPQKSYCQVGGGKVTRCPGKHFGITSRWVGWGGATKTGRSSTMTPQSLFFSPAHPGVPANKEKQEGTPVKAIFTKAPYFTAVVFQGNEGLELAAKPPCTSAGGGSGGQLDFPLTASTATANTRLAWDR